MFEWKRKQLEIEQVKFFKGTMKKFISCYAKQVKPRIKIKLEPILRFDFNPRYAIGSAAQSIHMQQQANAQAQMALANAASISNIHIGQGQGHANLLAFGGNCGAGQLGAGSLAGLVGVSGR